MHKTKLTDLSIRALAAPEKGHLVAWDDGIPGFGVRISQGGTKSFFVLYGRERARHQIGRFGVISLADARHEARRFLAQRTLGHQEKPSILFSEGVTLFLDTQDHLRPSTKRDYERLLKTRFEKSLKHYTLAEIQSAQVSTILDKLADSPAERKYAHSVIRRFFKWAVARRLIDRSPVEGMDVPKPVQSRDRVLTPEEIKLVWDRAGGMNAFGAVIRLCILTAQRRGALGQLRGEWVDRTNLTISFPSSVTKQKKVHVIPIGPIALSLLPDHPGLLFPARGLDTPLNGWSKSMATLIKLAGVAHFVPHDLRRSALTMWARLGIDHDTREFLMGHTLKGIEGVYDHWDRMEPMRAAVARWEAKLASLVDCEAPRRTTSCL